MNTKEANLITGGLSNTSKMPGHSTGLPAADASWVPELAKDNDMDVPEAYGCSVGGKLSKVKGTTCAECYAVKGMYYFKNVKLAQLRRANGITHDDWVEAMAHLINSKRSKWFRWHDSGDIVNMAHLQRIVEVCKLTPSVSHWMPTREAKLISEYIKKHTDFPTNLTVRISATKVDGAPTNTWHLTSTVHSKGTKHNRSYGEVCPAPKQGGECKDCRQCWSRKVRNIGYGIH